ncbi:MAG: acylphosphatase [Candidatus Micrarchaeota archaeon]
MKRLKIIAHGRVQRVGYRDAVAELARKIGIKGSVRNLEDEVSVEIVAEGEEKHLNEFLKQINIQSYTIAVEKIDVHEEKVTGEFKHFKILRGEANNELGERIDVAGNLLYRMVEKQDKMLEKQDQTIGKLDEMLGKQDQTIGKLDAFHKDTVNRFDVMEQKYGKISVVLERISTALEVLAGIRSK